MDLISSIRTATPQELPRLCREIMRLGSDAIPSLVAEMAKGDRTGQGVLGHLLEAQRGPESLSQLISLVDRDGPHRLSVLRALGRHRHEDAAARLLRFVSEAPPSSYTERRVAVDSLGSCAIPSALGGLLRLSQDVLGEGSALDLCRRAEVESETGPILLLCSVAKALARLGDMRLAQAPSDLLSYEFADGFNDFQVHERAAEVLLHVVGPTVLDSLRSVARGSNVEAQRHAVRGLYMWATPAAVDALIEASDLGDSQAANNARLLAVRIIHGFDAPPEADARRDLWEARRRTFDSHVCYRAGRPLTLDALMPLLDNADLRRDLFDELVAMTGEDFGIDPFAEPREQDAVADRIRDWWDVNRSSFPDGKLLRWGRAFELA